MAAPIRPPVPTMQVNYVNFVLGGCLNDDGTYLQPEVQLRTQAIAEFHQLSPDFQWGTTNIAKNTLASESAVDQDAAELAKQYDSACHMWNSWDQNVKQKQTTYIMQAWQRLHAHYTNIGGRWTNWKQSFLVQTEQEMIGLPNPLRTRLFRLSMDLRARINDDRRAQLESNQFMYQNPSQVFQHGNKIAGAHLLPAVLLELQDKQVLPPATGISTTGMAPVLSVLHHDPNLQWQFEELGAGGQGATQLYTQKDATGKIHSRVVVKETHPSPDAATWRDSPDWYGDVTADNWEQSCVPMEFHAQKLVGDETQSNSSIRVQGQAHIDWEYMSYRLYMDYAGEGDIHALIRRHQDHSEPIPEKFIWLCFQALIDNAMIMKQGGLNQSRNPWSEMVHCDLKPDNVFLAIPTPGYYSQWPTPKLGDFGLANVTSANDFINPLMLTGSGTPGYLAPEQETFIDSVTRVPVDAHKILSPCNVYGIAATLYAMMTLQLSPQQPSFLPGVFPGPHRFDAISRAIYNQTAICNLIEQCMATDPSNRPTVEQLKSHIDQRLMSDAWAFDRGGSIRPQDDTLLLPNYPVKLKWASRMNNGPGGVDDPRVARAYDSDSSNSLP